MSNFPNYPDLLNITKIYIETDTSRASGIISDMTTTTPRQHTHLFRVQHDGRRQNDKPTREQPLLANPSKPNHHRPKTTGTDGGSY
jgi:hypothetical protein